MKRNLTLVAGDLDEMQKATMLAELKNRGYTYSRHFISEQVASMYRPWELIHFSLTQPGLLSHREMTFAKGWNHMSLDDESVDDELIEAQCQAIALMWQDYIRTFWGVDATQIACIVITETLAVDSVVCDRIEFMAFPNLIAMFVIQADGTLDWRSCNDAVHLY